MRILGVITARGGSKGIPRKNLAPFGGRPLLQWTCEAALAATELESVILSTEDEEIAGCGKEWGVAVPFMRPPELARDDTPTLPVLQHALRELDDTYDAVCLLQPTSPLRRASDIDDGCRLLRESGADSVVSMAPVPCHFHPCWVYFVTPDGMLDQASGWRVIPRRQELPPAYYREGSLYITRREVILDQGSLYGARSAPYFIAEERSGSIDVADDLRRLEECLEHVRS